MSHVPFIMQLACDTPKKEEILYRQVVLPRSLSEVLDQLKKEPKAQIFLTRVSKKVAPNYFDVIKNPMDLATMTKKLPLYRDTKQFHADLDLIWSNCLLYNKAEYYIDCATEMKAIADSLMKKKFPPAADSTGKLFTQDLPDLRAAQESSSDDDDAADGKEKRIKGNDPGSDASE